jgi:hypothetical protein
MAAGHDITYQASYYLWLKKVSPKLWPQLQTNVTEPFHSTLRSVSQQEFI